MINFISAYDLLVYVTAGLLLISVLALLVVSVAAVVILLHDDDLW